MQGERDPVVRDPVFLEVVGPDLLAAVAAPYLSAPGLGHLRLLLLPSHFEQSGLEHAQRLRLVLDLRFLVLAAHHQPGRKVGDAHRRIGGVHALAAGSRGTKRVHAQILGIDLDLDVLGLREHGYRDCGGMDASGRLGRRHPLHAMHPALELQPVERALALDHRDDFLDTSHGGFLARDHVHPEPVGSRVLLVHAEDLAGEERGFLPAGPGPHLEQDVAVVVRIPGEEPAPDLIGDEFEFGAGVGGLLGRQLGHLGVRVALHFERFGEPFAELPMTSPGVHQGLQLGMR